MNYLIRKWNRIIQMGKNQNRKLTEKLTFVYLIFVLLPSIITVLVGGGNYYHVLWEKYYRNAEEAYFSEVENLEIRLRDIEKVSAYFVSNSVLMEYVETSDMTIADSAYAYLKYFKTLFHNAKSSNQHVTSVTVYTLEKHSFEMTGILENLEAENIPEEFFKEISGRWIVSKEQDDVTLNYCLPLYNKRYDKVIGILNINVNPAAVMSCFTEEKVYFCSDDGQIQFEKSGENIRFLPSGENIGGNGRKPLVYTCTRESSVLEGTFLTQVAMPENFVYSFLVVFLPMILMLMVLLLVYQSMMQMQIKRITGLSEYISQSHTAQPKPYREETESGDEIGTLIKVYNHNIQEISRLNKEITMAELQRKDSEFYALQAQIKPHFLYNTLENIRMTAEQENDLRTSAMLEILGSYMRYGLKKDLKYTYLSDELSHIRYYQQLMDIRFPGKVNLKIAVYADISEIMCPYLLLQPLIENAVKHGMKPEESIDIRVDIREASSDRAGKDIEIKISNNGYKIEADRLNELNEQLRSGVGDTDGHVGLNNINFRLISCYGKDYFMRISNGKSRGCLFVIYLPMEGSNENTYCG